jgi:hypothetical protein
MTKKYVLSCPRKQWTFAFFRPKKWTWKTKLFVWFATIARLIQVIKKNIMLNCLLVGAKENAVIFALFVNVIARKTEMFFIAIVKFTEMKMNRIEALAKLEVLQKLNRKTEKGNDCFCHVNCATVRQMKKEIEKVLNELNKKRDQNKLTEKR